MFIESTNELWERKSNRQQLSAPVNQWTSRYKSLLLFSWAQECLGNLL